MPIPTQGEMHRIVLGVMLDGKQRSRKEIKLMVLPILNISTEECNERTSSGEQVWVSRAGWAISYLNRAGMLDRVSRAIYRINDQGKQLFESGIDGIDLSHKLDEIIAKTNPWKVEREQLEKDVAIQDLQNQAKTKSENIPSAKSPEEQIDDLATEINASLRSELISLILEKEPAFFEQVVVDLLEKMGYGKGKVISYSNDGGIDGLITTDELGFNPIYTQAKRYNPKNKVGAPAVQSFMGALGGISNGVFITTSSFTPDAIMAVNNYPHATIILIDGDRLTELMIKYNLGVTPEKIIEIKRIDIDYFEDE